jgi:hypothetical protein
MISVEGLLRRAPAMAPVYLLLPLTFLTVGCGAGWHQPAAFSPGPMPDRQQVQVWSSGRMRRWHAVRVTEDSISGVPFAELPNCPHCRGSIARIAVDSVRVGNPVAGFWKTIGLALGVSTVLMGIWCEAEGGCHPGNRYTAVSKPGLR